MGDVRVPGPIRAAFTRLTDLLPPQALHTLRVCAVIGETTEELLDYLQPPGNSKRLAQYLPALVRSGLLVERTRGAFVSDSESLFPATRDSLDGTTAVISDYARRVVGELLMEELDKRSNSSFHRPPTTYVFRSFCHQETAYESWGLEARRRFHLQLAELATSVHETLPCLASDAETILLKCACFAWSLHHLCMAEEYEESQKVQRRAYTEIGSEALYKFCSAKVRMVFGRNRFEDYPPEWETLHLHLVPWLRGIVQAREMEVYRRWNLLTSVLRVHSVLVGVRKKRANDLVKQKAAAVVSSTKLYSSASRSIA